MREKVCVAAIMISVLATLASGPCAKASSQDYLSSPKYWQMESTRGITLENNELLSKYGTIGAVLRKDLPPDVKVECQMKVDNKETTCQAGVIHLRQNIKDGIWSAYRVEFRPEGFKGLPGHILIYHYRAGTVEGRSVEPKKLFERRWQGKFNVWYNLCVSVKGNVINVNVDGEELCAVVDKHNYAPVGRVGLASQKTHVRFRRLKISTELNTPEPGINDLPGVQELEGIRVSKGERGERILVVENDYLRLAFSPDKGGAISSLIHKKTGSDLTTPGLDGMILKEWVKGYKSDWANQSYNMEIDSTTPKSVSVKLSSPGRTGSLAHTVFSKIVTVKSDSSAVDVRYEFHNKETTFQTYHVPLRFYNSIFEGDNTRYYIPTTEGIRTLDYSPGKGDNSDNFFYNLSRGWLGGIGKNVGFVFDLSDGFKYMMCELLWLGRDLSTVEWMFRTIPVESGESLTYRLKLIPCKGLTAISGTGGGLVGEITTPKETITYAEASQGIAADVKIYFSESRTIKIIARLKSVDGKIVSEQEAVTLRGEPDTVKSAQVALTPAGEGTYIVEVCALDKEEPVLVMEEPLVVGASSGQYVMNPREQRLGDDSEKFSPGPPRIVKNTGSDVLKWSLDYVTPHIKWADPYEGEKIKALILCDYKNSREIIELAQRLSIDLTSVTTVSGSMEWASFWGYGNAGGIKEAIEESLNEEYDVILISGVSGWWITEKAAKRINEAVKSGTGLIFITPSNLPADLAGILPVSKSQAMGPSEDNQAYTVEYKNRKKARWSRTGTHYITRNLPLEYLPQTDYLSLTPTDRALTLANVGDKPLLIAADTPAKEGRSAVLTYMPSNVSSGAIYNAGLTPYVVLPPERFQYWEYYHSLLARCIVWAARRESNVSIRDIVLGDSGQIDLTLESQGNHDRRLEIDYSLKDENGKEISRGARSVSMKGSEERIRIRTTAELTSGLHFADVIVKQDGFVVDWGTGTVEVAKEGRICEIRGPDHVVKADEQFAVVVEVAGKIPVDASVILEITDSLGRVVYRNRHKVTEGKAIFSLSLPHILRTVHTATAALFVGDKCVSRKTTDLLTLPEGWRSWDDYVLMDWGATGYVNGYLVNVLDKRLHELGFSASVVSAHRLPWDDLTTAHKSAFVADQRVIPDFFNDKVEPFRDRRKVRPALQKYHDTKDKQYLVRTPSYSDPELYEYLGKYLDQKVSAWKRYYPFGYCLGDESSYTGVSTGVPIDFDYSPLALAEFREWLKTQYSSIDNLNTEWKRQYKQWGEVVPLTLDEAQEQDNYAPWADHRMFSAVSTDNMYSFVKDYINKIDDGALVMISAPKFPRTYMGLDYSTVTRKWDSLVGSTITGLLEVQRSFMNGQPMASWVGYGSDPVVVKTKVWEIFMQGYSAAHYNQRSALNPDYSLRPDAMATVEVANVLQSGVAKLLWDIDRQNQVAIHYSQPSITGIWLEGDAEFPDGRLCEDVRGWTLAIEDMGFQPQFLSAKEILDGGLSKYKVFVLPYSVAIGKQEAQAISEFVKGGGLLIGDCRIGLMNEHCNPEGKSELLEQVFGIRHRDRGGKMFKAQEGAASFGESLEAAAELSGMDVHVSCGEHNLETATGKAVAQLDGGTPCYVINSYGKGHALYLNFFLTGYYNARKAGMESPIRSAISKAFDLVDLVPPVSITGRGGESVGAIQRCHYTDRRNSYYAMVKAGDVRDVNKVMAEVRFPASGHLYDVLSGEYIGEADRITTELSPGDGRVFALMDYRVEVLAIEFQTDKVEAGEELRYHIQAKTNKGMAYTHVFRVELYDPQRQLCRHYSANLLTNNGEATGVVPLALNDSPGRWKFVVRDVASGVSAEKEFEVRNRQ